MDWNEILTTIVVFIVTGLLSALGGFIIKFTQVKLRQLQAKSKDDTLKQLLGIAEEFICDSVDAVTQTTVSELKKLDKFDKAKAKEIKDNVVKNIVDGLTEETKSAITEVSKLDLETYVGQKIEAYLNRTK